MPLPVTITGISTAVACVGTYKAQNSILVDVTLTFSTAETFFGTTGTSRFGQSFLTPSGATNISGVIFRLSKVGSPTDNLVADIYAVDGSGFPTGPSLGTSNTVAGSSLPTDTTTAEITFTFATAVNISASTTYAAVVSRSGSLNDANCYRAYGAASSVYADGKGFVDQAGWGNLSNDCFLRVKTTGGAFYFFGRDSGDPGIIVAKKATDPTDSFTSAATNNALGGSQNRYGGYQVSDGISITIANDAGSTDEVRYCHFDMSSDTFDVTNEAIVTGVVTNGQTGVPQNSSSIVVRSNGNAVAFFNGAQTKKSGTNYARLYWSERTGVNIWSAAALVVPEDAVDYRNPECILGASDRVHFTYYNGTNHVHRSLSSANVLDTAANFPTTTITVPAQGVSYDNAGTIKVVVGGSGIAYRFDSGANPTLSTTTVTASVSETRFFNDGTDVWALYRLQSDSDLYVKKSTDNGAGWGSATNAFTATVGGNEADLSIDGNIYLRGSDYVMPYLVNDNGTLKYNEFVVRSLAVAPNNGWSEDPFHANDVISKIDFRPMAYQ